MVELEERVKAVPALSGERAGGSQLIRTSGAGPTPGGWAPRRPPAPERSGVGLWKLHFKEPAR